MYDHAKIEKNWQKKWAKQRLYKTPSFPKKKKFYVLDMFPYPSGEGLHVGHLKGYIATDIVARFNMMQGYSVLHPMGWDAFGLPAENYAIQYKIHPSLAVKKNIKRFKEQLEKIGLTYDWSREINTTDPDYYKWTQWIFLKMFEKGLTYQSYEPINWCPSCQTGLANEDLEGGRCERCGSEIERKPMRQWVLKMTAYADRLLEDLKLLDWDESIIEQQKNWIGRSEGTEVDFQIVGINEKVKVFTTRLDTIFSGTYIIFAPEHPLVERIITPEQRLVVKEYIQKSKTKSDVERMELNQDKTGVFTGAYVINPATEEKMPIWISDFILFHYGSGAVFADAHDERDFDMAKKYNIPLKVSIRPADESLWKKVAALGECYPGDGILVNSGEFDGLTSVQAREKILIWLEKKGRARKKVNYKMRDWVFSRQRYWGEPIPLVHCQKCGVVPVFEKDLPVKLPQVKHYQPAGTGESPLADIQKWVNIKCPKCQGPAKRETNTMPQWAGSCWYYLRYIDPQNKKVLVDKNKEKAWMMVDLYVGGAEHATRHLLYARFWHKFLDDLGVVSTKEPFHKLINVGLIAGEDGRKMSKRWKNVVNPDGVVEKFGADSLRLYEMFMGPFTQGVTWNIQGVVGMRRFLEKVYKLKTKLIKRGGQGLGSLFHKTIKKVTEDIENFHFNTAISTLMVCVNELENKDEIFISDYSQFLILLSPFAPYLAEELWFNLGHRKSIFKAKWPKYHPALIQEKIVPIVIQINGKLRDEIEVFLDSSEEEVKKIILAREKVKKWVSKQEIKKIIFIPNRLINLVI